MRNAKSKRISALVSLLLVMTVLFSGNVFASEGEHIDWVPPATSAENPKEYFEFTPPKGRVDSSGNFSFSIHNIKNSNKFTISASTVSVTVSADILDHSDKNVSEDFTGHAYAITLYTGAGSKVGTRSFTIGGNGGAMFYGLDVKKQYFISVSNTDFLESGWTLQGSGTLSNIASVL